MNDAQVEELAKAKLEKPKRLKEQAAKEWREIDDGTRVFRRPEVEVASLRQLTKPDLAAFFAVSLAALQASCPCFECSTVGGGYWKDSRYCIPIAMVQRNPKWNP